MSLPRGRACLDCRRRKVKCDGAAPACSRCVAAGHGSDCEYTDTDSVSRIKILEDNIVNLEAKIARLEHEQSKSTRNAHSRPLPDIQIPGRGVVSPNPSAKTTFRLVPATLHSISSHPDLPPDWWIKPVLPLEVARLLIDIFAPHAFNYGFFLHGPRFLQHMFPPDNSSPSLPLSLISVVYLWGIHLSGHHSLMAHEESFLNRAIMNVLKSQQPHHIVPNIQAEVLLAHYFLRKGKFNSAMHHLNSAISHSVACGLHQLGSQHTGANFALPPPSDSLEFGERLDAFWAIVLFHKSWVVALQWPSRISTILDDMIYAPFPLEMSYYESGSFKFLPQKEPTLRQFLDYPENDGVTSDLAVSVQLLSISDEIIQFHTFDRRLSDFIKTLPPIESYPERFRHSWLVSNSSVQAAIIQLHSAMNEPKSREKCLQAAEKIGLMIHTIPHELEHVNPILGTMWFAACRVFIPVLSQLAKVPVTEETVIETARIKVLLKTVLEAMTTYGTDCALMYSRLGHAMELCQEHEIQL
ncbi:hypothetical protein K435DRAFT_852824 [Dendrothele bispora CBS 962.96]|uniref:Zn(2)-C6 fungal-type domain-containing protein n=1 Tax=Dendrothele bispora (strain CBS 962.96) TaxID=1314807 RepID=A0A4S8MIF2_DENBC|nr:hypothetical protein K435DRAFT_852824 [Dendrothele bispora CBS 962.96]